MACASTIWAVSGFSISPAMGILSGTFATTTYPFANISYNWKCEHCSSLNPSKEYRCHNCGAPRKA